MTKPTRHAGRRRGTWWIACGIPLALVGCATSNSIDIGHEDLAPPPASFTDELALERVAEDRRGNRSRIGRTTFSVFAITSGSVKSDSPLEEEVVREVAHALEAAGYRVTLVDTVPEDTVIPWVTISIEEFAFTNYTWLSPYIRTWGDIALQVVLRDPNGTVLLEESFRGSGSSNCLDVTCGFSEASRRAMTELLNQVVTAAGSERFRLAFEGSSAAPHVAAPPPPEAPR